MKNPIEHASFTFGIEGVSRALLAQITRHRMASFSVQSQRYVSEISFEYVLPPSIAAIPEAKAEFLAAMEEDQRHYNRLTPTCSKKPTRKLCWSRGRTAQTAERMALKMAIEDARFVLPNACDTKMVVTMNARSLKNFFALRCCNRAQWEIREVAIQMLVLARKAAPHLFAQAGPGCVRGNVREGENDLWKNTRSSEVFP